MARSKRVSGRAAKRKVAAAGGHLASIAHAAETHKYYEHAQQHYQQPVHRSAKSSKVNSSKLRDHAMAFVPSTSEYKPEIDIVGEPGPNVTHFDKMSLGTAGARTTSPTPSDSSAEVVVFPGRALVAAATISSASGSKSPRRRLHESVYVGSPVIRETHSSAARQQIQLLSVDLDRSDERAVADKAIPSGDGKSAHADYAANMAMWEPDLALAWTNADRVESRDLCTPEDPMASTERAVAIRSGQRAQQYLNVSKSGGDEDDGWTTTHDIGSPSPKATINQTKNHESGHASNLRLARELCAYSEEEEDDHAEPSDSSESESDSGREDSRHAFNDRLMQRRMARMTDEQLAQLFLKQEQLGIDADELLLFDHNVIDESSTAEEGIAGRHGQHYPESEFALDDQNELFTTTEHIPRRAGIVEHTRPRSDTFNVLPHEDYGSFDIMDFDRPSLKKAGRKDRKSPPSFGLSDEELENHLKRTWATDRQNKRQQKQEREALRSQGLLGRKNKLKPSLETRYNSGLGLDDFRSELEDFLDSDHTTLALPPMDKADRRTVHVIVNSFNLRSKSQGNGKTRFAVVYKTSKTIDFSDMLFDRIARKVDRQYFSRPDRPSKKGKLSSKGGAPSGVSYGHGDTVGASAPELGIENRGRAMLEKMGWSKGDALGTADNQGILQPIAHVVRKTRAGLG